MSLQIPKATNQRIRGTSFKNDYSNPAAAFAKAKGRARQPSMIGEMGQVLIPPQEPAFAGRVTVVLDLDETLIYARQGPLYARPGLDELLQLLKAKFEPVVWTAGVRAYAHAVVRNIDKDAAIQHTVYRHKKWFNGVAGYNKDLRLLGRDLKDTLIIENTPDCLRGNETNGVLVADYEGGEEQDVTLLCIQALLEDLADKRATKKMSVPEYIQTSKLLSKQQIPTDLNDVMTCYCLDGANISAFLAAKATRVNRDLKQ